MKKRVTELNENTPSKKVKCTPPSVKECHMLFNAVKENKLEVLIDIVNAGNFEIGEVIRPRNPTQPRMSYDFLGIKLENSLLGYALSLNRFE